MIMEHQVLGEGNTGLEEWLKVTVDESRIMVKGGDRSR